MWTRFSLKEITDCFVTIIFSRFKRSNFRCDHWMALKYWIQPQSKFLNKSSDQSSNGGFNTSSDFEENGVEMFQYALENEYVY